MPSSTDSQVSEEQQPEVREAVLQILAYGLATDITAQALTSVVSLPRKALSYALLAAGGAASLMATTRPSGIAGGRVNSYSLMLEQNRQRAAYFLIASAKRIADAPDPKVQQEKERDYFREHLRASANRLNVGERVQKVADREGSSVLGWYAAQDARTSPDCRSAHGHNFRVLQPPERGYPGAVHPRCRCKPGAPFPGAKVLD